MKLYSSINSVYMLFVFLDTNKVLIVGYLTFDYNLRIIDHMRIKSIELLVPISYIPHGTSTLGLSTWWSSTALKGALVLRGVSRLDAFSGYPFHI